ncbi:MAG: hypothetical protein CFH43_00447, partial [Proteobacteria bacterium]
CVGYELTALAYVYKLGYIAFITALAYGVAYRNMKKRIFD